jgi:hypothetical protein
MLSRLFGGKPDHPMADMKEARRLIEEIPGADGLKALDELGHWLDSVSTVEGFRAEYRAQLLLLLDETAQAHVRRLQREYLSTPRASKFVENRLWNAIHEYWRRSGLALARCIDLYATGQRGAEALKPSLPLLTVRALRAFAAQMKWQYLRYGPFDNSVWGIVAKVYALAESRRFSQVKVQVYPKLASESSAEQEFLGAVMLSASSPDSLLPLEIELVERLITHFSESFRLSLDQQPDIAYWIDLATGEPPLRLARPPQHAPTLRFFAAGSAMNGLEQLIETVSTSKAVPASVGLGGSYEPDVVLDALRHLALYWAPMPPARKAPRHKVKSRLTVTHGLDGVLAVLDPASSLDFDQGKVENWIVEDVSIGGFGAIIPQMKGDWLGIDVLLALQPDGGNNWVIGVVRRFSRESAQQASVGIETLARTSQPVRVRAPTGEETGILLNPSEESADALCLLPAGLLGPGQNLEFDRNGKTVLLIPAGVLQRGADYELLRFKQMVREAE